jgi:hypothetical protein
MPPDTQRGVEDLREIARALSHVGNSRPKTLSLPDALACVRFGIAQARRALEIELARTTDRSDRSGIGMAQEFVEKLAAAELRLDLLARSLGHGDEGH